MERIHQNGRLFVLQGEQTLVKYKLPLASLEELLKYPIGWSAYSGGLGQYRIKGIKIDGVPFEREEVTTEEE